MLTCRVEFSPDDTYAAHIAAREGCADDLRAIHERGGEVSLRARDVDGRTAAHFAAFKGHEACLRVLHELGGSSILCARQRVVRHPPILRA